MLQGETFCCARYPWCAAEGVGNKSKKSSSSRIVNTTRQKMGVRYLLKEQALHGQRQSQLKARLSAELRKWFTSEYASRVTNTKQFIECIECIGGSMHK